MTQAMMVAWGKAVVAYRGQLLLCNGSTTIAVPMPVPVEGRSLPEVRLAPGGGVVVQLGYSAKDFAAVAVAPDLRSSATVRVDHGVLQVDGDAAAFGSVPLFFGVRSEVRSDVLDLLEVNIAERGVSVHPLPWLGAGERGFAVHPIPASEAVLIWDRQGGPIDVYDVASRGRIASLNINPANAAPGFDRFGGMWLVHYALDGALVRVNTTSWRITQRWPMRSPSGVSVDPTGSFALVTLAFRLSRLFDLSDGSPFGSDVELPRTRVLAGPGLLNRDTAVCFTRDDGFVSIRV